MTFARTFGNTCLSVYYKIPDYKNVLAVQNSGEKSETTIIFENCGSGFVEGVNTITGSS